MNNDTLIITGNKPLIGDIRVSGAKNVALKLCVASLLTDEEIVIHNIPIITDVLLMLEILEHMGVTVRREGHTVMIKNESIRSHDVPLDKGAHLRTSSMVIGPLLARYGEARIPNPGGCRIGARPIDRHIDGLRQMGATVEYHSHDGYFYAKAQSLHGIHFRFSKNSHTGTETLILAAVLAKGTTILENAAEEIEIDDLIAFVNQMGANVRRTKSREIRIEGVSSLHGATYTIMPDRNEEVTFAIAAAVTGGTIVVHESQRHNLTSFIDAMVKVGAKVEPIDEKTTQYSRMGTIHPTDIVTAPYPGFMTDWQAPWSILMTQADGVSTVHETIFESRFSYVSELKKMGARIDFYDPLVDDPHEYYNFNWNDRVDGYHHAIRINGPTSLHNAILDIDDLRAGATLVLAALAADGESYIHGIDQIDRGYEDIEKKLQSLGAHIARIKEDV